MMQLRSTTKVKMESDRDRLGERTERDRFEERRERTRERTSAAVRAMERKKEPGDTEPSEAVEIDNC